MLFVCFAVVLTNLGTTNLSGYCFRKFIDELDDTRILVRRGLLLDVLLNFFFEFVRSFGAFDKRYCCLDDYSAYALRIRRAGYRTLENIRKFHDDILNLKRSDTVSG